MINIIDQTIKEHIEVAKKLQEDFKSHILTAAIITTECIKNGNKVLIFGNGGSAADSQHIAAEFTGRFEIERRGLPAIALTTDTSALTAISNDYGYDQVFSRQVEALANEGDVLIGISTSGNSENVVNALKLGEKLGCKRVGLSGRDGGAMNDICDINIAIPSNITARIQEMHIMIGHLICKGIDLEYQS